MEFTVINLLPIADGGGMQNALSFLETLAKSPNAAQVEVIARAGGQVAELLEKSDLKHRLVKATTAGRLKFELGVKKLYPKGTICFTLFGPPLLGSIGYFVNINGCAYSNLFYPEVHFWQDYTGLARFKRDLIDVYRRKITSYADIWVFETEVLSKRAVELCKFPEERVKTVRMAASALVSPEKVNDSLARKFGGQLTGDLKILFLNGPNRNKRVQNLPAIANGLKTKGVQGIQFVTTLPETSDLFVELSNQFKSMELSEYWVNVGPISQSDVPSLISECDAMATFSRLESFSNNFVEAWRMKKLLLATDADWARSACGGGAIYLNPDDSEGVADALMELLDSEEKCQRTIECGADRLKSYPTVSEKNEEYLKVIKYAQGFGSCPQNIKRLIKWPSVIKTSI